MFLWVNMIMDHWTKWYWEREAAVLREKPAPLPLAEFFLNSESFKKSKHILYWINFFPKIVAFMRSVEKYDRGRQLSDYNIIRLMRSSCWVTKAINTNSEYVFFFPPHCYSGYANVSHFCVYTLPILLFSDLELMKYLVYLCIWFLALH